MKRLLSILLLTLPAFGQVAVTANTPTFNFQVLPGSTREVNAQVTVGGTQCASPANACTVNWSITGTSGGATATFTTPTQTAVPSIPGGLPVVTVNIGSTAGSCSISPVAGSGPVTYTVSSTATVTVQAQSVDDPSKTASFLFNVCSVPYSSGLLANGTNPVIIVPAYRQAYKGQLVSLQSWVVGQTDQTGNWAIESAPAGGNATLADTSNRDTVFNAGTVAGRYLLAYTSHANGALVGQAIIYVSPDTVPSYFPVGPEGNMTVPCDVDPTFSGADYEVGAGKAFPNLTATPAIGRRRTVSDGVMLVSSNVLTSASASFTAADVGSTVVIVGAGVAGATLTTTISTYVNGTTVNLAASASTAVSGAQVTIGVESGTIYRVWNTDTTGLSPSTYHEYFQVANSGTATQPIMICGVPDSLGNLPIIDGSNAVGQSGISLFAAGYGIMNIEVPAGGGPWQQAPAAANTAQYISFTGLHIRNANPNYNYTPPGGGSPVAYGAGSACIHFSIGQYVDVSGNDIETCGMGLFSDDNNSNAFWNASQNVSVVGNHFHNNGFSGISSCCVHQLYFQSYFGLMEGNKVDSMYPGGTGADVKWRGTAGIFRYNYFDGYTSGTGPAIQMDLTDNQDGLAYVSFEGYLTGGYAQWPSGYDTAGANIVAAYQESQQQDFAYGNIFVTDPDQAVHYNGDEASGMADRNGTLYFYSNTIGGAAQVFRTNNNAGDDSYLNQRVDARNNIVWAVGPPVMGQNSTLQFGATQSIILNTTTNLFETGSISIATPITGGVYTGPSGPNGWYAGPCSTSPCPWPLTLPFDPHLYNLSAPNYLTTATQPFNSTTYIPPSGSAAIGAGTALTGYPAKLPVRYNWNVSTGTLTPRTSPLTIGAEDPSGAPTVATPTFSPVAGSYGPVQTVTISTATGGASIVYTNDGTTPTVTALTCTITHGTLYSTALTVSTSQTLKAIGCLSGDNASAVGSAAYVINGAAATPTFSPPAGSYSGTQTVTLATASSSCTGYLVWNTTNAQSGGNLTGTSSTNPLSVASSETIYAQVQGCPAFTNSAIGSATYVISTSALPPTFSPVAGTYTGTQTVTISTSSGGAIICYNTTGAPATNGTTGCTTGTLYSGPVAVSTSQTLYAVAGGTGFTDSSVANAAYVIKAVAPTFSPVAGTYTGTQTVTISTVTSGAIICYNTTGSPATNGTAGCTTGTLYSGPVTVSASETLYAVAGGTGFTDSSVGSAAYVIQASTPTFSPPAGTYTGTQAVTLATASSACTASIVWNTTGAQSGGNLTGTTTGTSVTVASSETVYAQVQSCAAHTNSAIGSAAYVINAPSATTTITGTITITGGVSVQ